MGFWWNILSVCQVWDQGIQYHLSSTHRRLWGLVVVWLSKLSGRALAAHARVILGSTPADCRTLYFCLITFKSLFPAWSKMLWANIYYTYNNHDQLCPNQSEGIFSDSIIVCSPNILRKSRYGLFCSCLTSLLSSMYICTPVKGWLTVDDMRVEK